MKILFGTPIIEWAKSVAGKPFGAWKTLDMPKQGTSTLDTPDGTANQALDEEGKVVDQFTTPGVSTLVFELFRKKGLAFPFIGKDGVADGEYAFRVRSKVDPNVPAYQIDRASVVSKKVWTVADGYRRSYTATALEPAEGDMVKELGVTLEKDILTFGAAADSTGKTVEAEGNGTIAASAADSWCTPTVADNVVTVKVNANTSTEERSTIVSVSDSTGFDAEIAVFQEGAASES